ncbi:MAG: hypothetical protein LLG04_02645 [Parachlamydia sp.]|nr:hypothetical protein [Parachlamydia sp.]
MTQKNRCLTFLIIFSINIPLFANATNYAECDNYLNQLITSYKKQMKDEFGLVCSGDGGSVHDKIEEIQVNFRAKRRATIDEARALHVLAVEKLAQLVNNHQGIQPYLIERPFTFKRIGIMIDYWGLFESNFDGSITHVMNITDLATVAENKNNILYYIADPFTGDDIKLLKEPFEESVRLTQASAVTNPHIHQTTVLEKATDEIFMKLGKELAEKNRFYVSSIGGKMTNGIEEIGAKFIYFDPTTMESARNYEVFLADRILTAINSDLRLRPYLKEYPFPPSRLKICLQFRTKKHRCYDDGSLAHVTLENNVLSYFRINPKDVPEWRKSEFVDVKLFAKESYVDALEAIRNAPTPVKKKGGLWR